MSESGLTISFPSQAVRIDSESLPTGMEMPRAGQSSSATARTVSKSAASSPGWPAAAIQLAESFTFDRETIDAAARLVSASPTAMRPDAGGSMSASGRALADGEGLAGIAPVVGQRDRAVGHRHLPRADEGIARAQATDGAVADGDEEGLVGDARVLQHAVSRRLQRDPVERERLERGLQALYVAQHLRRSCRG